MGAGPTRVLLASRSALTPQYNEQLVSELPFLSGAVWLHLSGRDAESG